jgi:F-type H+-transporting ATPase subunit epsilon
VAQKTFRCRLITPEAQVLDEPLTQAVVPAWDGLFGILPGRAPIVARLGTGELRLDFPDTDKARGGSRSFFVDGGFVQMVEDRLTILAAHAVAVENMVESELQAAASEANSRRDVGLAAAERQRVLQDRKRATGKLSTLRAVRARGGI